MSHTQLLQLYLYNTVDKYNFLQWILKVSIDKYSHVRGISLFKIYTQYIENTICNTHKDLGYCSTAWARMAEDTSFLIFEIHKRFKYLSCDIPIVLSN